MFDSLMQTPVMKQQLRYVYHRDIDMIQAYWEFIQHAQYRIWPTPATSDGNIPLIFSVNSFTDTTVIRSWFMGPQVSHLGPHCTVPLVDINLTKTGLGNSRKNSTSPCLWSWRQNGTRKIQRMTFRHCQSWVVQVQQPLLALDIWRKGLITIIVVVIVIVMVIC